MTIWIEKTHTLGMSSVSLPQLESGSASMGVTLQKSKCNSQFLLCLLTLYINLGKSGVNTALQIPEHNWLGYGQIYNCDGVMGPCHADAPC